MPVLLQIALGGALGSVLRFAMAGLAARLFGTAFPWGTFAVNLLGSFVMGVIFVLVLTRGDLGWQRAAPFLMPGLLGGFTTFSAFSLETFQLLERGRQAAAAAYVGGSVVLGLLALTAGVFAARGWLAP